MKHYNYNKEYTARGYIITRTTTYSGIPAKDSKVYFNGYHNGRAVWIVDFTQARAYTEATANRKIVFLRETQE